jgi:alpha-1,2-glucosyltransferase
MQLHFCEALMSKRKSFTFFALTAYIVILAATFIFLQKTDLLVDEYDHHIQIVKIVNHDFTPNNRLTMLQGYHYTMAACAIAAGNVSREWVRFFSLIFSFITVVLFFIFAGFINDKWQVAKTGQYAVFPITFPFFFLIYTDIFSLLFVLLAFYLAVRKRYLLSGIAVITSMLARQNNIIWLVLLFFIICYEEYGFRFNRSVITDMLKKTWIYLIGIALFIGFVIINKGIAVGDIDKHPAFVFHSGNIFFALFVFFILFLPLNISNAGKIIRLIKRQSLFIIPTAVAVFLLYWFTYTVDHPYNLTGIEYFVRNKILMYSVISPMMKLLFFVPILYSLLSIAVTPLLKKSFYFLYPFTAILLCFTWMIEQRYYIIPFVIFLLVKKEENRLVEYFTMGYYAILSLFWVYGMGSIKFFI